MEENKVTMVPPDGGYGWVIVFAHALSNIVMIPVFQSFGLLYKGRFADLGFSATDCSTVINMNAALSMMTGLFNGPMLNRFGYRKYAFASAAITSLGLVLTAYADTFPKILFTYGIFTSLGMGMGMSAYPLAVNSFFSKKRNRAVGLDMTISGLGSVFMPQVMNILMNVYDIQGACLVIAALTLHSFVSASLLRPISWYRVPKTEEVTMLDIKKAENIVKLTAVQTPDLECATPFLHRKQWSFLSIEHDEVASIFGLDTPLSASIITITQGGKPRLSASSFTSDLVKSPSYTSIPARVRRPSFRRTVSESQDPTFNKFSSPLMTKKFPSIGEDNDGEEEIENPVTEEIVVELKKEPKKKECCCSNVASFFYRIFDLDLLKDPIFVSIMAGLSMAVFAEMNFSISTPFILDDYKLTNGQIATFLSFLSLFDIAFRSVAPYIGDFLGWPNRILYMASLVFLVITRFTLTISDNYPTLLVIAAFLGMAKGFRTVYMSLVLPSYVPLNKLANASGMQSVVNGTLVLLGGIALGFIRDITGSYVGCINILNCITVATLILWTIELLYRRHKAKKGGVAFIVT